MAQYKVMAAFCPGIRKVHKAGDVITEIDVYNAEQRVKDGFLVEIHEIVSMTVDTAVSLEIELPKGNELSELAEDEVKETKTHKKK